MKKVVSLLLIITSVAFSYCQSSPKMRYEDKIRIKEAIKIRDLFGNEIWNEIDKVPFVVLLVKDSLEYLINHPYPSKDFMLSEKDEVTGSDIYFRKKKYSDTLLATFPAVNGVPCIVIGTPEKTNKNSCEWILTILHEHFHQYQFSQKDYYNSVEKLELSNGDQTGMWQLNYPFSYEDPNTNSLYDKVKLELLNCLEADSKLGQKRKIKKYIQLRNKFENLLKPADYRYFSFQIWQEGLARYTEYRFLQKLVDYLPSIEIKKLPDYMSFIELKNKFYKTELKKLKESELKNQQRICFYSLGFAEGILLDKQNPNWQEKYLTDKFYVEKYYKN